MITLQCQLEFQNKQDKEIVLNLMRRFSSAMRYAYKRLLEGNKRKDLKKQLSKLFNINTRYSDDAIFLAQSTVALCEKRGQNPKKLVFGSRKLFEQLKKNHLTGKRRKQLKTKWKESRQGNLYSRGDKSKQGNLNLRFQWIDNQLYLRINTGDRQYIYAKVIRDVKRDKDKWIDFMFMLENVYRYKQWFPYSVRLRVKNSNVYAFISVEEKLPPITITKDNGIIGIDVNAYPFHLALAFTSKDEVADVDSLSDDEKLNGIDGDKTFVPYDKGDKDGNRWWAPTPYYIDWSRENVRFLKENSGKKGEGMPVVRNQQFYFREGFCWTDVNSTYLKSRIKEKGVYDVLSMSLFTKCDIPDYYYVCMINSKFISEYVDDFVNSTSHFQINDARQLPIIIPTPEQLKEFELIFDQAKRIQEEKFSGIITEKEAEERLEKIQKELDEKVLKLYGLE